MGDKAVYREVALDAIRERLSASDALTEFQMEAAMVAVSAALDDCEDAGETDSDEDYADLYGDWDEDDGRLTDGTYFADPGGRSALRASGPGNPRNLPCPNCSESNRLTPADRARGYQCDACADRAENPWAE
jgi:hypothetical protein